MAPRVEVALAGLTALAGLVAHRAVLEPISLLAVGVMAAEPPGIPVQATRRVRVETISPDREVALGSAVALREILVRRVAVAPVQELAALAT